MKKLLIKLSALLLVTVALTGCKDYFDPAGNDVLSESDYVGTRTELFGGYYGLLQCLQEVSEKAIFIEGLRGEFLEPTYNAPEESGLWDIYYYRDHTDRPFTESNAVASPEGYYRLIINANDYIQHVREYYEVNPTGLSDEEFRAVIGGALRLKAWAYLMIAKIYGEGIYFDDPLIKFQDISIFPVMKFDELLTKCIDLIETGVEFNGVQFNGHGNMDWPKFIDSEVDSPSKEYLKMCPPVEFLLGELYLWKEDYRTSLMWFTSAVNAMTIYDDARPGAPSRFYWCMQDTDTRGGSWRRIFQQTQESEHVTYAFFDFTKNQVNNLVPYFSNQGSTGEYYLRPSWRGMQRFIDAGDNNRGNNNSFGQRNGEPVVLKWLRTYGTAADQDLVDRPNQRIHIYRMRPVYLMMMECMIHLGRLEGAYYLLNGNPGTAFASQTVFSANMRRQVFPVDPRAYDGTIFEGLPPRLGATTNNVTSAGIRGQVDLQSYQREEGKYILTSPNVDIAVDQKYFDSLVIQEYLLECAAEPWAYYAMIRNFRRWPENVNLWADWVSDKYYAPENGDGADKQADKAAVQGVLSDPDNWFVKFDLMSAN